MPLAAELSLQRFNHIDPSMRGPRYREAMAAIDAHDDWLAACPLGFLVLERASAGFFLRPAEAAFPGMTIAELFGIREGPLHEEIIKNIINVNVDDHRRLRNLVNP